MNQTQTADDAIARSISHDEIVDLDYCSSLAMDLLEACEDSCAHDDVTEFWGTTEDGDQWRVHLHGPEAAGDVRHAQLIALRREARMAQDRAMASLCDLALAGDIEARDTCARSIRAAVDAQDTL